MFFYLGIALLLISTTASEFQVLVTQKTNIMAYSWALHFKASFQPSLLVTTPDTGLPTLTQREVQALR